MELYPHQQTALEETRQYSRVAYYLDMGLGKTFVGSEKMRELNSPVNLIVCQKSKVEDWEKHMIENYAMDLDGVISAMAEGLAEVIDTAAEGVHE